MRTLSRAAIRRDCMFGIMECADWIDFSAASEVYRNLEICDSSDVIRIDLYVNFPQDQKNSNCFSSECIASYAYPLTTE